ncbi:MAG: zinc-binding dehydrogenase [Thermoanaerobaculia bacterium]|nr:zinc-binding dehydrogenase [Thermoanaerobaculia bacterium]
MPAEGEALIRIRATALNRADLLQIRGLYPPPPGESPIPGLECAGEIEALGQGSDGFEVGQRVMALLAGGGHAQKVVAPVGQVMPIPGGLSFEEAAALPEAALTAWTNLVREGELAGGETALVVAAASGVGTFAVQLARELGARVIVAGRDRERLERLKALGADACVVLGEDFVHEVRAIGSGRGVDLIMDLAGGADLGQRMGALKHGGRCVLVGVLAGMQTDVDLADMLRRRLRLIGSVLRARSRLEKAELVADFSAFAAHRLEDRRLKPVIDRILPFEEIADAYRQLREGGVWGKIVLRVA